MAYAYLVLWVVCVTYLLAAVAKSAKQRLIIGLSVAALSPGAVPTNVVGIPGVVSALLAGCVGLAVVHAINHGRARRGGRASDWCIILLSHFAGLVAIYVSVSEMPEEGLVKALWFGVKCLAPAIAFFCLSPLDGDEVRVLFDAIVGAALLCAAGVLLLGQQDDPRARLIEEDVGNAITVARTMGLGAAALLLRLVVVNQPTLRATAGHLSALSILLVGMLAAGSRGPIVAIIIATIGTVSLIQARWQGKWSSAARVLLLVTLLVPPLSFAVASESLAGLQRITAYFTSYGENTSDAGRVTRATVAIDAFIESRGWGIGTGAFATVYGGEGRQYPHNLILEVACEQGIPGLALVGLLFAIVLRRITRYDPAIDADSRRKAILGLWFFAFANALVSGDIVSNSQWWICSQIAYGLTYVSDSAMWRPALLASDASASVSLAPRAPRRAGWGRARDERGGGQQC